MALSKKTQVSGFKWNHWCIFLPSPSSVLRDLADYLWTIPYLSVTWDPGWLHIVVVFLLIVPSQVWYKSKKHHVSDVPWKNIWSWCSCIRIVSGQVRCNQKKNTIWVIFLQKNKDGALCFFACLCRFRFGTIGKNISYLRELEILHCFCFLHKHLRKWKAFADYFLLLEDLPHQLSYLCYLYSIEHGRYFTDFLDMN